MKFLFVINPISGDLDKSSIVDSIDSYFKDAYLYYTSGEDDSKDISKLIKRILPNFLVAIGGDGTVRLVAETLINLDYKVPIGIVPAGSANGLSSNFNIPHDTGEALEKIAQHTQILDLDVIRINENYHCIHISDAGINARIVRDYSRDVNRGLLTYAKYLFEEVTKATPFKIKIRTEKLTIETSAFMIAIANFMRYGTGVKINQISDPTDGKFEITILKNKRIASIFKAALSVVNIDINDEPNQKTISCRQVQILFKKPVNFQIDGELVGELSEINAKILKRAVQIII